MEGIIPVPVRGSTTGDSAFGVVQVTVRTGRPIGAIGVSTLVLTTYMIHYRLELDCERQKKTEAKEEREIRVPQKQLQGQTFHASLGCLRKVEGCNFVAGALAQEALIEVNSKR